MNDQNLLKVDPHLKVVPFACEGHGRDMMPRTIYSVAKICDKWNTRVEDLRASTSLILGFDLGDKLRDYMVLDLLRKFQFRYKNPLFVFAS